jgi:hypothetical protein
LPGYCSAGLDFIGKTCMVPENQIRKLSGRNAAAFNEGTCVFIDEIGKLVWTI